MQFDESNELRSDMMEIEPMRHRFPCCVVWTPIPVLTWLFPFVGHMGIATSRGIIRDFAGSYCVSEDNMAFGWPTWYHQIDPNTIDGGVEAWDRAVLDASEEYKGHVHTLFFDNCYCHVALALNKMKFGHKRDYNCFRLVNMLMFKGRYVGIGGFIKQWLPFTMIILFILIISIVTKGE
ncbi:D4Ertd196e protein, putative [Brugia malayi]|uniref:Bm4665 n=1 Tax=Brugia malayi TaxID=6279 RepID=A0A0I9N3Y8_BRUMA|nr:D4Ertd196e protein, putative [Brugia malayi]CTP80838.1 Bm4665 [Brugia malayi]VIO92965.1 D4Ertd196e protein, putative [Brugia malayi]